MNDFRESSTMELFFSITTDFKIKMKRFEELFKEQVLKMTSKPENKDIRKELKNEKDFKIANKKMKKLTVLELEKQADEGDVESQFCLGNYYFILENHLVCLIANYKEENIDMLKNILFSIKTIKTN